MAPAPGAPLAARRAGGVGVSSRAMRSAAGITRSGDEPGPAWPRMTSRGSWRARRMPIVTDHRATRVGWPSASLPELDDLDDAALAEQVGRADPAALAVLYRRHADACQRLAWRMTANSVLAEEAVQETFAGLWGNPAAYRPDRGSVRGWLLALTRHKAVDAVRRESAQQGLCHLDPARQPHDDPLCGDPAAAAWERLRAEMVRSALAALPQAQRQPLALAYFGGYTQQEIADLIGVPLGTVKARIYAAMRQLEPRLAALAREVTWW